MKLSRSRFPRTPVPDQYLAFTTRLSADGYQNTMMRIIGYSIIALGIPAFLAAVAPPAVPWPGFRVVYIGIAIACVFLALPWMRYCWPTRQQSTSVIVLGAIVLAAGCLATIDPMSGLLTSVAFLFVLGLTALFHNTRLLTFAVAVAALTIAVLTVRIAASDIAKAIAVATPLVLMCILVTYSCRTIALVGSAPETHIDLDPVTGLLTRDSFYERTSNVIGARHRDDDRYLVIAMVGIDGFSAIAGVGGPRALNQSQIAAGLALRETVRRDAVLGHVADSDFVIADTFTVPSPDPLVERVRSSIAATGRGMTASIGVVSTPLRPLGEVPPHEVIDELVALASRAMAEARRAGGNQARFVLEPDLNLGD